MIATHLIAALAVCALTAAPTPAAATAAPHPYHLSLAEVECNAAKRELQVSLAMMAIDFEETLSRRAGKRVNLDRTEGIGKIIEDYLAERFVVTLPDGSKPRPSYVGREDNTKLVWIYFTVPLTGKPPAPSPKSDSAKTKSKGSLLVGTRLKNRVLMELNAGQINKVTLREGHWRRMMRFEKPTQEQVLRTKAPMKGARKEPLKDPSGKNRSARKPGHKASQQRPLGPASRNAREVRGNR